MYQLTPHAREIFKVFEWKNWFKVFDTSPEGFVLWFWLNKEDAIERWLIEKKNPNPLHELCENNSFIQIPWIAKHLWEDKLAEFLEFMIWQGQSEYGIFSVDVKKFLERNWL